MSTDSAEIAKLSINCFVTTKISYANMIGDICDRTPNADKIAVLRAVGSDSRVGLKYLKPGYGYGGPASPSTTARSRHTPARLASMPRSPRRPTRTTTTTRACRPRSCSSRTKKATSFPMSHTRPSAPVPIIEESQKLEIARILAKNGRTVRIVDKDFIVDKVREEFGDLFQYGSDM